VQRDAKREAVADFLVANDIPLHTILLSSMHGRNNRTEGYVLAHRNGSGNKLEGERECLSGIRSSHWNTKGRSAKRNCIEQTNCLRQRTNFTWTYVFKRYLFAILAHH